MCFWVFTTVVGVSRFYRMGIRLMGKYQSQGRDCERFKAGAEKAFPGLHPAVCVRGNRNLSQQKGNAAPLVLTF